MPMKPKNRETLKGSAAAGEQKARLLGDDEVERLQAENEADDDTKTEESSE